MGRIGPLIVFLALLAIPASAQSPEADVTATVKRTFDAYNKGDTTTFRSMFMPTVRGFFIDNGVLQTSDDIQAPASGPEPKPNVSVRNLSVRVYGNTAVIAGYFVGTMYIGGQARNGTWRFTETRIKDGNVWKTVQYHFSPLAPLTN